MNVLFFFLTTASLVYMLFTAPEQALSVALGGAKEAVELSVKMLAVYALWLGVLGVMKQNGVTKLAERLFRPVTKRLFKGESDETRTLISENLAANFLGIGAAATPLGIKATALMQGEDEAARDHTVLFLVINACGVQLLPATIVALRASAGSLSSSDVILPTVLSTLITAAIGISLTLLTRRRR